MVTWSPGMTISTPSGRVMVPVYVGGTEVELWTIAIEEWFMTATFFFRQDVYLCFELGVWGDGV